MPRNRRLRLGMLAAWQPSWSTCAAIYLANVAPRPRSDAKPRDIEERNPSRSRQTRRLVAYQPAAR
jgi:hypothetical protein